RWGWLSLITLAGTLAVPFLPRVNKTWLGIFSKRLIVPMSLGVAVGVVVFAPFSLHVYLKHEFPLLAFLFITARAGVIYTALKLLFAENKLRRAVAVTAIAIFALDGVMTDWNNRTFGPALNFRWTKIYREYPNERIALATYKLIPVADTYMGIVEN